METIKLSRPLLVNGEERTELPYDLEAVSSDQFIKAESIAKSKAAEFTFGTAENDYAFHLELGFAAIMAADQSVDQSDLERITGRDLMAVMRAGRNFIGDSSDSPEDETSGSEESGSGQRSESTPTSTASARTR